MSEFRKTPEATSLVEQRVAALEQVFIRRNLIPTGFVEEFTRTAEEDWAPANGARVVARAWTAPDFKRRLLENGKAAVAEFGFAMLEHHEHLVAPENTPNVHNVICCTSCSCTPFTIIGLPPGCLPAQDEPTCDVRFRTEDLRPQSADEACVHVSVFQSYLEKAA